MSVENGPKDVEVIRQVEQEPYEIKFKTSKFDKIEDMDKQFTDLMESLQ